MFRTQSGRFSKTMVVVLASAFLQTVPALAALQAWIEPKTWAILSTVMAFLSAFATLVVRQITTEPMAKPKKMSKTSTFIVFLLVPVLTSCFGHAAWDEDRCPVVDDVRRCGPCKEFVARARPVEGGWLTEQFCDGMKLPLDIRSESQPAAKVSP
jgi:hypothetical protein